MKFIYFICILFTIFTIVHANKVKNTVHVFDRRRPGTPRGDSEFYVIKLLKNSDNNILPGYKNDPSTLIKETANSQLRWDPSKLWKGETDYGSMWSDKITSVVIKRYSVYTKTIEAINTLLNDVTVDQQLLNDPAKANSWDEIKLRLRKGKAMLRGKCKELNNGNIVTALNLSNAIKQAADNRKTEGAEDAGHANIRKALEITSQEADKYKREVNKMSCNVDSVFKYISNYAGDTTGDDPCINKDIKVVIED